MIYEILLQRANEIAKDQFWLTEEHLARILEISEKSLKHFYKRPEDKQPPRIVVGHEVRFPKEAIIEWIAKTQARGA